MRGKCSGLLVAAALAGSVLVPATGGAAGHAVYACTIKGAYYAQLSYNGSTPLYWSWTMAGEGTCRRVGSLQQLSISIEGSPGFCFCPPVTPTPNTPWYYYGVRAVLVNTVTGAGQTLGLGWLISHDLLVSLRGEDRCGPTPNSCEAGPRVGAGVSYHGAPRGPDGTKTLPARWVIAFDTALA